MALTITRAELRSPGAEVRRVCSGGGLLVSADVVRAGGMTVRPLKNSGDIRHLLPSSRGRIVIAAGIGTTPATTMT
ncbi:hypothetical protein [Sphingomonas sp.]|uniref:hypothetical protein n=1 Tax=Sphingomonas sp. TaxID=28214 RepID=UPI003CC534D4